MKKFIYALFLLFISYQAFPQQYGNEWINYNQQYFRIFVVQDGIYRIDSATLANAGINLATLNPKNIEIFGRGALQHIYIKGETDGKFNAGDYIEFFGMHNDGWYDSKLYYHPSDQPNPNYSMFNDTAVYFLTINLNYLADTSGRMLTLSDTTFSSYSVAPYFNKISRADFTGTYFYGQTDAYDITDPEYANSEGWFDWGFSINGSNGGTPMSTTKNISTLNPYSSGNATIDFKMIGASNYSSAQKNHHVTVTYPGNYIDDTLSGYYSQTYSSTIPVTQISSGNAAFTFTAVNDLNLGADYNTVAYINIKYPHTLNLENDSSFTLYVPNASGQTKTYLRLSNFHTVSGDSVRFYDLTNHKRIKVAKSGNYYKVLVPNASGEKKCYITSEGQINQVTAIIPVSYNAGSYAMFRDFTNASILQSDYIVVTHKSLWIDADAYRAYRESANGGSYHPLLVNIDDLYDQFCYGIRKDPVSLKNFALYAYNNFNSPPKDLFIVGKGYRATEYRKNTWVYSQTLVPGFGVPPSDVLFTKFDSTCRQWIPTGRLAARKDADVNLYLNKVVEYEEAQYAAQNGTPEEWMKNILHFGGGGDISQQNVLAGYLNNYKHVIEGPYFGGFVRTFLKSSPMPIQQNLSDSLKLMINNGVSLMTFFGHGAGIGFDMSTDYPSAYDNKGKYPMILALSCLAGDLYNDVASSSEEFIIIQDKGAIAYVASIGKGIQNNLDSYATYFYDNIGVSNYGKPVGTTIQNTIDTLQRNFGADFHTKSTILEMTLHGDPALIPNYCIKPDYKLTQQDIYFSPSIVTTNDSVFTLNVIGTNIGRAVIDTFVVYIKRTYPDGTFDEILTKEPAPFYKDTFQFRLPVNLAKGVGLNTFTITLDYFNTIDEISETNNTATTTLIITSDDITPVYPYEFAIVPKLSTLSLKASTGNPFAQAKDYIFELDTSDAFTNPLASQVINHSGGVVTWTPVFPILTDSIVYYWRVASADTSNGGYKWHESSFQYIPGKRGWGQAHFFQFKNDSYQYVSYNKPSRKFEFYNNVKYLMAQTGYYVTNDALYAWTEEFYKINQVIYSEFSCPGWYSGSGAIKIAVFDSVSCAPWQSPFNGTQYIGPHGEFHCAETRDDPAFDFYFATDKDRDTVRYFLDHIPPNDYVLVMTHQSNHCSQWDASLINAFQSIGSSITATNRIPDNYPYILFGRKGATPGSVNFRLGDATGNLIQLNDSMKTKWNEGYVRSALIGPASSWDSLHWRVRSIDPTLTDKVKINVYGIRSDGTEDKLIKDLSDTMDISLWNRIDSTLYPYLRLEALMSDDTYKTPSQMVRWQVTYDEVPETAIDPSVHYSFYKDTIPEGDSIHFSTAIHNISDYDMDSLLVHYWIIDANRMVHPVYYHRYRPHPSGDILIDTVSFSTLNLSGLNSLWIEANPNNDQPEQYHFNNMGEVFFYVNADHINPLLDVTFDGVHILDGDIVSAKPMIEIRLKDENKFLLLNEISDTSLFKVYIQKPNASTADRIYFKQQSMGEMNYFPTATASDNKSKIELNADFPEDGTYKLIVQASDKSKNESGDMDYEINFEVINKSTITEVMNWPNPFSTSTRFVFTLTGSEIPTYFKIQIMTITGKVVREISMEDLGPIHIGRNITQYAWDGKDDYGDQLANGVYLYRVVTNINGKNIDKNPSGADKFFKQEFGKMVLIK